MGHVTVLLQEVVQLIAPRVKGRYFDGTLGGGGHAKAILDACAPDGMLAGTDLDEDAYLKLKETFRPYGERAHIFNCNFTQIDTICKSLDWESLSGIVLDLGVSSFQFDTPEKGFSFSKESPLDMRFKKSSDVSAYDIVNTYEEASLARIIWEFGQDRFSRRIAKAIIQSRPVNTTTELAMIVSSAVPKKLWPKNIHPATRTFQAIRIEVNRELENLKEFLPKASALLETGGILAIISFHSLEDRIVKQFFAGPSEMPSARNIPVRQNLGKPVFEKITKKPVSPSDDEMLINPRSRSAKLRAARRVL